MMVMIRKRIGCDKETKKPLSLSLSLFLDLYIGSKITMNENKSEGLA